VSFRLGFSRLRQFLFGFEPVAHIVSGDRTAFLEDFVSAHCNFIVRG
jgi:hypothetical protein